MIGTYAMEKLKAVDEVAYVRFASVYRQFKDINSFMEELSKLINSKTEAGAMTTICGMDCCSACARKDACGGCVQTGGHPSAARALRRNAWKRAAGKRSCALRRR